MSTTIDSLQIEIQTSSTNAAVGIRDLAKSLGELKANGTIGVATKNLKALSDALRGFTDASNVTRSLGKLSGAMERLKSIGSVTNIANGIKKLNENLRGIDNINIDNIAPQIERIATALAPLSAVKAGGISTMMNGLKKLGEVTKSLDDEAIGAFAQKVQRLSEVLTPLSEKMTTIQGGFRGINSAIRQTNVSVQQANAEVNVSVFNLSNMINVIQGVMQALNGVVLKLQEAIGVAIEWDGIAARFGRGFGAQAEETYAWIQRLNEEMGINVQQFMQYSSVYATMLTGFGVAMEDAGKMALGYTELTYDIWAGYNDVYKNFSDAAEAVKSAIAGEVEPIRRAGFTIVESTLEQTAANHGLSISIEKATEAQKSYLRYLTLVDQANSQGLVGTYAKELQTAEGLVRTLSQQMNSLKQAFGSLFLPVLVQVIPWLQAFVDLLTEAVHTIAGFFGFEIQKVDWSGYGEGSSAIDNVANSANSATGALDSATKAAKELKNATLGIDELNVISPPTASSSSGGSGSGSGGGSGFEGLDVDSLWDESIFDHVQSQVDEIKQKVKGFFGEWGTEIKTIGGLLATLGMSKMLEHLGEANGLGDKFLGVMKNISKLAVTGIVIVLQYSLMAEAFDNFIDGEGFKEYIAAMFVGAIGTGILRYKWGPAGLVIGLTVIVAASLKAIIDNGGITNVESATVALTGFAAAVVAVSKAWPLMKPVISGIKEYVESVKLMSAEVGLLPALFPKISGAISSLGTSLSGAASAAGTFLAGISAPAWAAIAAAIAGVIGVVVFLQENWDAVTAAAKRFFDENIVPKLDSIKDSFAKMGEALGPVGVAIEKAWKWIKDFVSEIDLLDGAKAIFEGIGLLVVETIGGAVAGAFQMAMGIIEGFVQAFSGIVQIVSGVVTAVVKLCSGDLWGAWDAVKQIGQGIADVFFGLYDMTIGAVVDFVEGIIDWCVYLWDELVGHSIIPDTIDGIVKCFVDLPGKVLGVVGEFVGDVIDKFKNFGTDLVEKVRSGWDDVKKWWSSKPSLATYTPSVGSIKDKLSSAWTAAKNWWNNTKGTLKTYTPNIGSIYDKLKPRWDNAKEWWDKKKSAMKQYTPNIGSIYEKAKERWDNARDWWNKKKAGMNTYTPSIGSIKSKLQSAWNTAKDWWKRNVKLSIPSLSFKVTYSNKGLNKAQKAIVKALGMDGWPKLSFAAAGGVFDQGSLVWAGERGPEVVANAAGGRTGVMNVQQMQDAVYEGVYAAVVAAMSAMGGNGGSQPVNVYLDGRQITAAVERRQRERGASILGNQVYSY